MISELCFKILWQWSGEKRTDKVHVAKSWKLLNLDYGYVGIHLIISNFEHVWKLHIHVQLYMCIGTSTYICTYMYIFHFNFHCHDSKLNNPHVYNEVRQRKLASFSWWQLIGYLVVLGFNSTVWFSGADEFTGASCYSEPE